MELVKFKSVIASVMIVLVGSGFAFGFAGGDGSEGNPWQISTISELEAVNNDLSANYILVDDIDLSSQSYTNAVIAPDANNINYFFQGTPFDGIFDGNGHVISGMTVAGSKNDCIGLFGMIYYGAVLKNLVIEDSNITVGDEYIGSLAGINYGGSITNCYSLNVYIHGNESVGGLVGLNWDNGEIGNCYATGTIMNEVDDAGGLVGRNYGSISLCYSTGEVSGSTAGGLVGENSNGGSISDSYAKGQVSGEGNIGGLVGLNWECDISNCHATCIVTGGIGGGIFASECFGGLAGKNRNGVIADCYSTGQISAIGDKVGGLIGWNDGLSCNINSCYSMASVDGIHLVGGLIGWNSNGSISNSYAVGTVNGGDDAIGGLVGYNTGSGNISKCFSSGHVTGTWRNIGGLIGDNFGNVNDSFWDVETSGQLASDGGTGKTTDQMQMQSTFTGVGWDFSTPIWKMLRENEDYPRLAWQEEFVGDIAGLYGVDMIDFVYLSNYWGLDDCGNPGDCGRADIDSSGDVGISDLVNIANDWLK